MTRHEAYEALERVIIRQPLGEAVAAMVAALRPPPGSNRILRTIVKPGDHEVPIAALALGIGYRGALVPAISTVAEPPIDDPDAAAAWTQVYNLLYHDGPDSPWPLLYLAGPRPGAGCSESEIEALFQHAPAAMGAWLATPIAGRDATSRLRRLMAIARDPEAGIDYTPQGDDVAIAPEKARAQTFVAEADALRRRFEQAMGATDS